MKNSYLICTLLAVLGTSNVIASEQLQPFSASKAVDLTHELHNDMVYWPGGVPFKKEVLVSYKCGGYLLHKFSMG